ncbi:hypothetical protein ACP4OV_013372 [Aristida adscensionis]
MGLDKTSDHGQLTCMKLCKPIDHTQMKCPCMSRYEETLQPSVCLKRWVNSINELPLFLVLAKHFHFLRLPDRFPDGCLCMHPMLAPGGTMSAGARRLIKDHGAEIAQIRVILQALVLLPLKAEGKVPRICVYVVAAVDPVLNEKWFIIPGLGLGDPGATGMLRDRQLGLAYSGLKLTEDP